MGTNNTIQDVLTRLGKHLNERFGSLGAAYEYMQSMFRSGRVGMVAFEEVIVAQDRFCSRAEARKLFRKISGIGASGYLTKEVFCQAFREENGAVPPQFVCVGTPPSSPASLTPFRGLRYVVTSNGSFIRRLPLTTLPVYIPMSEPCTPPDHHDDAHTPDAACGSSAAFPSRDLASSGSAEPAQAADVVSLPAGSHESASRHQICQNGGFSLDPDISGRLATPSCRTPQQSAPSFPGHDGYSTHDGALLQSPRAAQNASDTFDEYVELAGCVDASSVGLDATALSPTKPLDTSMGLPEGGSPRSMHFAAEPQLELENLSDCLDEPKRTSMPTTVTTMESDRATNCSWDAVETGNMVECSAYFGGNEMSATTDNMWDETPIVVPVCAERSLILDVPLPYVEPQFTTLPFAEPRAEFSPPRDSQPVWDGRIGASNTYRPTDDGFWCNAGGDSRVQYEEPEELCKAPSTKLHFAPLPCSSEPVDEELLCTSRQIPLAAFDHPFHLRLLLSKSIVPEESDLDATPCFRFMRSNFDALVAFVKASVVWQRLLVSSTHTLRYGMKSTSGVRFVNTYNTLMRTMKILLQHPKFLALCLKVKTAVALLEKRGIALYADACERGALLRREIMGETFGINDR